MKTGHAPKVFTVHSAILWNHRDLKMVVAIVVLLLIMTPFGKCVSASARDCCSLGGQIDPPTMIVHAARARSCYVYTCWF